MHLDPMMPYLVSAILAILLLGLLLRKLNQPHVVGYLIAGVILGPHGVALVTDDVTLARFGAVGVVMLLFLLAWKFPLKNSSTTGKLRCLAPWHKFLSVSLVFGHWVC